MTRVLAKLGLNYLKLLALGVWSGICIAIGAAWMYGAVVAALRANGLEL